MKTPRELLLARHQSAAPKLDAIRRKIIAELNHEVTKKQSFFAAFVSSFPARSRNLWLELIWPSRRVWASLAAVWLLLFAANFSMRDHSQPQLAVAPPLPQTILAFHQQEQMLTELIGPNDPPPAEPAKPIQPRPTSERRLEIETA